MEQSNSFCLSDSLEHLPKLSVVSTLQSVAIGMILGTISSRVLSQPLCIFRKSGNGVLALQIACFRARGHESFVTRKNISSENLHQSFLECGTPGAWLYVGRFTS
jgi:hypothetical protein